MKKPNLRSIKGPNRAAKYAKQMKAYTKYLQSAGKLVKSPGGKVVKSPGGKLATKTPGGKLVKSPGGKVVKSPKGEVVKSPKGEITKSQKGKLLKTNNKGVISETANFSKDKVTARGTRTGKPGKNIKLLESRKGAKGQNYQAPKIPKSARKTSRAGRFVDRVTTQQKSSAKGLGKRLNKLNRIRQTLKTVKQGDPGKLLKASEKAQRTLKITRGAKSLRGILNPKNFKNLSSIKTAGAGYVLNSLADVGVRRLSRSISNKIFRKGEKPETQKEYNARIEKLKGLSRSEKKALLDKQKGKTVKAKTPIVSAGSNNKKRNKKKVVKQVTNKTSTPTTNKINKIKASDFDSRKTKVEKKVEKKVTPIVDKKVTPIVKTKTTVTPTVNKTTKPVSTNTTTKKSSTNPFRRTKGEGVEGKSDGYRGDTRITRRLKKSGFTETRLAKLREKNAAFQKAKKGGKEAMKAYRKTYPKK
tara:strand:- start:3308 stop:4720 length:1413 start_codon:yes stop_codon:yes gene_type:complete